MAGKEVVQQEINTFVSGLITEASQLNFPPTASRDEENWVLNRDGTRNRRLGFDSEEGSLAVDTGIPVTDSGTSAIGSFKWENAGDDARNIFIVTQVGSKVFFHEPVVESITAKDPIGEIDLVDYPITFDRLRKISWASISGRLVGAWGSKYIILISYNVSEGTFSVSYDSLKIRDQFGLDDFYTDDEGNIIDLNQDNNLSYSTPFELGTGLLTDNHLYNLRNQTWGQDVTNIYASPVDSRDPIGIYAFDTGYYPSNASNRNIGMGYDPENGVFYVFNSRPVRDTPVGNTRAPTGYFIIDALDRGESRTAEIVNLKKKYPDLLYEPKEGYNLDKTPGGATVIGEYAGHIFYAGFSGDVIGGDSRSPKLSSYILFSQLIKSDADIFKCYQEGDPTSPETSDVVATDGGFIRIPGAYGIKSLADIGTGLLVIAENGTWMLSGGSDYGFAADEFLIRRITNRGIVSPESVVVIDNTVMYWASDGIYMVAPNEIGEYNATNITKDRIQRLYNDIPDFQRQSARGVYDSFSRKIRWIYGFDTDTAVSDDITELIFDIDLGAFNKSVVKSLPEGNPTIVDVVEASTYVIGTETTEVTDGGVAVTDDAEVVILSTQVRSDTLLSVKYLLSYDLNGTIHFEYGQYRNIEYEDWASYTENPIDAKAYFITGAYLFNDSQRNKGVPYITSHMAKSEVGFDENFNPINTSSALCTFMWDWSDSPNSNRWSRPLQLYRHKRHYIPSDISDPFDNGQEVVVTKTKIRGRGRAFSMMVETEPKKDCQLLGWGLQLTSNSL